MGSKRAAEPKTFRATTGPKRKPWGNAGFTLTEVIAVIAIIAILAAVTISVGRYAVKRGRTGKAKATLEKLNLQIGIYQQDFGFYIPDSVATENGKSLEQILSQLRWPSNYTDALGKQRGKPSINDYDKSSEILFFFLEEMYDVMNYDGSSRQQNKSLLASLPRKKAYVQFKRNELGNTDADKKDELPEIVDGWGVPILYVARDRLPGDSALNIEPHEGKNPESFSLYSFGPDRLGYYEGKVRVERDYPVGDLDLDGKTDASDQSEMKKRIEAFAQSEGYSQDKAIDAANKDNLTNWQKGD